jgi:hypothetical protein
MGNNYGNLDSYDYYQYEPFIPIFFTPKDEESKKEESELYSSDSLTRKSTLDEEENEKKIEFKKKRYEN